MSDDLILYDRHLFGCSSAGVTGSTNVKINWKTRVVWCGLCGAVLSEPEKPS